jgi:hypothetical protein
MMNVADRHVGALSAAMAVCLILLRPGPICAAAQSSPAPAAVGPASWSHVDFVERYSIAGEVVQGKDLSGIACVSPSRCLIGADEGRDVQVVELSRQDRSLKVLKTINLVKSGKEIDTEAIACEGDCYYIIGSHGLAKKTGEWQSNRYKLFRLKVDPNTGLPDGKAGSLQVTSLVSVLQADPVLGKYFDKPLQHKGVNIEGLAIRNGTLFVGLRNPNLDGFAFVIEVSAADLFAGRGKPKYALHKLALGKGLGIREIVAAKTCFLIIAGNAGSDPSDEYPRSEDYDGDTGFAMFDWDGFGTQVHRIDSIPRTRGKAEAMTILDESEDHVTVLVLFDGVEGGRPTVYRIH